MADSFLERENLKVSLDVFEGPLDLLLYLIRKSEVDIYHVPMLKIINQYLEYVEMAESLDLEVGGDFILMSATLLHIKSRMLLPIEERSQDDLEEEEDPRSELIKKLIEYKKFKDVSEQLQERAENRSLSFSRPNCRSDVKIEKELDLGDITIFNLVEILEDVLNQKKDEIRFISHEEVRLEDKIAMIRETLDFNNKFIFKDLFVNTSSKLEVVVIFFAVLELIKMQEIIVAQEDNFFDIIIMKKELDSLDNEVSEEIKEEVKEETNEELIEKKDVS